MAGLANDDNDDDDGSKEVRVRVVYQITDRVIPHSEGSIGSQFHVKWRSVCFGWGLIGSAGFNYINIVCTSNPQRASE